MELAVKPLKLIMLPVFILLPLISLKNWSILGQDNLNEKIVQSVAANFSQWLTNQTLLKKRIQNTCRKYVDSFPNSFKFFQFLHVPKHNLLYCKNNKVFIDRFEY